MSHRSGNVALVLNAQNPWHSASSAPAISQGFCCFELEAWADGTHQPHRTRETGISEDRKIQSGTHPFPTSLAHAKCRQCARRKHSENENKQANSPHAGDEGHGGRERKKEVDIASEVALVMIHLASPRGSAGLAGLIILCSNLSTWIPNYSRTMKRQRRNETSDLRITVGLVTVQSCSFTRSDYDGNWYKVMSSGGGLGGFLG